MGACVSSDILVIHQISKPNQIHDQNHNHNHNQNQSTGAMDYYSSAPASKLNGGNFIIAASPICEKPSLIVTHPMPLDVAVKYRFSSAKFRSFGSNEDVFFESQPWLESDGDDEFYSVNGDLTPSIASSASNTPLHKTLSPPRHSHTSNDTISARYKLTLSPVKKRKSLSELFKEDEEQQDYAKSNHETSSSDDDTAEVLKSAHFPQHTFANSNVDVKVKKERALKSAHHCFPRLFSVNNPNMAKKNSVVAA